MLHANGAPPSARRRSGPGLLVKRHSTSGTSARRPKRRVTFSDVVHIKPICDDDNEDNLTHTVGLFPTEKKYRDGNQDPRISEDLRIKPHKCLLCNASVVEEVKLKHLLDHVYKENQRTPASQYFTLQEVLQNLRKLSADLLTRKTCKNSCSCVNCSTELPEDDMLVGPEVFNTYSLASTSTSEVFLQPYETSLPQEKSFFSFQPKQCEFCGKTFNTKDELKQHIKLHFKNEPEPCEVCGKTFQTEKELYEHVEGHFEITDLPKVDDYCTGFGEHSASGRRCDQKYQWFSWSKSNKVMSNLGLSGVVNLPVKSRVSISM